MMRIYLGADYYLYSPSPADTDGSDLNRRNVVSCCFCCNHSFTGSGSGLAIGLQYYRNRTFLQSPTGG